MMGRVFVLKAGSSAKEAFSVSKFAKVRTGDVRGFGGGLIPALPFLVSLPHPRPLAYALTALTALALGALKARYTLQGPVRAALEFLAIVTGGAVAGIAIGALLHAV